MSNFCFSAPARTLEVGQGGIEVSKLGAQSVPKCYCKCSKVQTFAAAALFWRCNVAEWCRPRHRLHPLRGFPNERHMLHAPCSTSRVVWHIVQNRTLTVPVTVAMFGILWPLFWSSRYLCNVGQQCCGKRMNEMCDKPDLLGRRKRTHSHEGTHRSETILSNTEPKTSCVSWNKDFKTLEHFLSQIVFFSGPFYTQGGYDDMWMEAAFSVHSSDLWSSSRCGTFVKSRASMRMSWSHCAVVVELQRHFKSFQSCADRSPEWKEAKLEEKIMVAMVASSKEVHCAWRVWRCHFQLQRGICHNRSNDWRFDFIRFHGFFSIELMARWNFDVCKALQFYNFYPCNSKQPTVSFVKSLQVRCSLCIALILGGDAGKGKGKWACGPWSICVVKSSGQNLERVAASKKRISYCSLVMEVVMSLVSIVLKSKLLWIGSLYINVGNIP